MDKGTQTLIRWGAMATLAAMSAVSLARFTDTERKQICAFWNSPDRYSVTDPSDIDKNGLYQVRLTPEGSIWIWNYNTKRGIGKSALLSSTLQAQNDQQKEWEAWIDAKIAHDRWQASCDAQDENATVLGKAIPEVPAEPKDPGPEPATLAQFMGPAPVFASAMQPKVHIVSFPDGMRLTMTDCPAMRARYAYFRNPQGVNLGGVPVKKMSPDEIDSLFAKAGITDSAERVMKAVSMLEGGFDSVNTYDTGFVSVGFIQFACLSTGSGSLGSVLLREKSTSPADFDQDFRQYGIDVDEHGLIDALDLATGFETSGPAAAKTIINDKRLAAVFQRAGRRSEAFRIAQLQIAKEQYYPASDLVKIDFPSGSVMAKVSDLVKSEAAMATLMDRKVNTGKIDPFAKVIAQVVTQNGLTSVDQLAAYEKEIVLATKFRKDYTADASLSQPQLRSRFDRSTPATTSRHKGGRKHIN